ncbi:MAG: FtsW/RodA/SpoVE family cell cycle protein, partial [Marinobacter sp.]|nr:FtsW/RodA/SpoVE family cell cycle protein [Marinobacter sp.]
MHADLPLQNRNPWLGEIQPLPMLVISSVALLVMGVVMISSASMDMAAETMGNSYHYVIRQLMFAGLGCLLA